MPWLQVALARHGVSGGAGGCVNKTAARLGASAWYLDLDAVPRPGTSKMKPRRDDYALPGATRGPRLAFRRTLIWRVPRKAFFVAPGPEVRVSDLASHLDSALLDCWLVLITGATRGPRSAFVGH